MDTIDRKILAELQVDGRLTLSELADRVGLSVSPCHRRVKELEKSKAIVGYRTEIAVKSIRDEIISNRHRNLVTLSLGCKNAAL